MAVRIGHAVASEFNNKYGNPGNQNGKELRFDDWYNEGWNVVLRPISDLDAENIAKAMGISVNNKAIGYNQSSSRTTYYTEALKVGFDLTKVEKACECDCSSLVSVCVNAASIKVSKDIYTGNMVKALMATGKFKDLTDKKYLTQDSYLKRGDILVHEGSHTAIVLTNGDKIANQVNDYEEVDYYATVTAFFLNVRSEANSKSKSIKVLKKNTDVHITKEKSGWGYSENDKGWVSLTHVKKNISQSIISPYIATTITTVNFRTAPNSSTSNNIITKFNKGQYLLIVMERNDGWVYGNSVIDGTVKSGWIFNDYLQKVNKDSLEKRRVTDATGLNIRVNGNSKASLIGTIPFNKEFYVVKNDIWGIVTYNDILGYSNLSKSYSEKV